MVVRRGEIWWAYLPAAVGSSPGFRRPVVVVQSNDFNASAIRTVVIVTITSNLRLAAAPGNVPLTIRQAKLKRKSVVNVSQILTVDKSVLRDRIVSLPEDVQYRIDDGLKRV